MMRRLVMMVLLMGVGYGLLPGQAQAQQCPGVNGWVFDDVPASDPFCAQITWMAQNGITLGCQIIDGSHRLYCPTSNVSRTQMAAFMQRLAEALFPLDCVAGQAMRWNGTDWVCANDPPGVPGPQGPAGPAGAQGPAGATGPAGPAGATGSIGLTGPQGPAGAIGATGASGATGAVGPAGPQGVAGTNGRTLLSGTVSPASGDGADGDFYIDTAANTIYGPKTGGVWGAATSIVGPQGSVGPAGPAGPTGAAGAAGSAGPTGATGAQGPQGSDGPQGPIGNTGPQGPAGAAGATGATGAAGPQGPAGTAGATGATGPQGPAGAAGATGTTGATGATGPQGADGPQGPIGLTGPQGPTGPAATTMAYVTTSGAAYTVQSTDYTVFCDVTSTTPTVTLPSAASNPGRIYFIRRVGSGGNQCNVTPVQGGPVTLDNTAFVPRAIQVQSDGSQWWMISQAYQ